MKLVRLCLLGVQLAAVHPYLGVKAVDELLDRVIRMTKAVEPERSVQHSTVEVGRHAGARPVEGEEGSSVAGHVAVECSIDVDEDLAVDLVEGTIFGLGLCMVESAATSVWRGNCKECGDDPDRVVVVQVEEVLAYHKYMVNEMDKVLAAAAEELLQGVR